jgi:predicted permease
MESIQEQCREQRRVRWVEHLAQDVRYGARLLRASPGFTAVAVLSLALGIGANTTVFCWIQSILLRPFPGVSRQEELAVVTTPHGTAMWDSLSLPDLRDQAKLQEVFAGVIGSFPLRTDLTIDGNSEWIYGQLVTANFFSVLGVKPLAGRAFLPEEDGPPGDHPVLVISEAFWKRRFSGDRGVVGRRVVVNRNSFTIIGIAPRRFRGTVTGYNCDFWAPLAMCQEVGGRGRGSLDNRSERWLHTQARLRPGVSPARAQAALDTLAAQLEKAYPDSNGDVRLRLLPLWKSPYGGQPLMLPVLSLLQAASLGVLLIVAVNVANLLLARATRRGKEIAIRLAMGAGRGRLIRQLLTENLLLSLIGGAIGVLLATWMVGLVRFFIPNSYLPLGFSVSLDSRILGWTLLLTLATGVLVGLVPALPTSRPRLNEALKDGGRSSASGALRHRVLGLFVVSQVALALVLLVCAGLCLKGLRKARQIDLGFDPSHLLYVGFNFGKDTNPESQIILCQNLGQRLASLPAVEAVAFAMWSPLGFDPTVGTWGVDVEGYPRQPNEDLSVDFNSISPGFLGAMHIPLLDGRDFTDRDDRNAPKVAMINEAMAQRFWPGRNPIGLKFDANGGTRTVVAIVKTGKYRSLAEPARCFFYIPYRQWPYSDLLGLCVRTASSPGSVTKVVRQQIHALDPGIKIWAALPMTDYIRAAFMGHQVASSLLSLLGVVAVALAAMGVYGVMAYGVSQRTHEFGIRLALGARRRSVLRLVLRRGLMLTAVGLAIGLMLAFAVTHLLSNFLYGVSPFDTATFTGVPVLLSCIALAACWMPARRAARVDPIEALRCE